MITRAYICIENDDHTYLGIYCHTNGNLTYTGAILQDYYAKRSKVEKLMEKGDLYNLKPELDFFKKENVPLDNSKSNVSIFYGRDLGQKNTAPTRVDLNKLNQFSYLIEYCYLYRLDDSWYYFMCGVNKKFKTELLELGLKKEYSELGFEREVGFYGIFTADDIAYYQRQDVLKGNLALINGQK